MIEVLVAMSLLLIVSAGVAPAFTNFMKFDSAAQLKTEAMAAAQRKLDRLRLENPNDMPTSGASSPETYTVNDRDFDVVTTYCERAQFCGTNNSRHIKVEVSYDSSELFQVETVFTKLR